MRVRDILVNEYENVEVRMSRTGDVTVSLAQRTNDANSWGADYYLSIHINAGGGTGFESFRHTSAPTQTARYQSIIHPEIALESLFRDRGMKTANFHVLRETRMPALLTENGFIDHATDASRLQNASFRASIARGHVIGLEKAFQLRKKRIQIQERSIVFRSALLKTEKMQFSLRDVLLRADLRLISFRRMGFIKYKLAHFQSGKMPSS